jgi:hypothetical protein
MNALALHHERGPGIHRIVRWRKQIGADLHPFSEIPDRPKNHTRYHRYVKLVRAAEAQLVKYLVGINRDIARRARLRGITPK